MARLAEAAASAEPLPSAAKATKVKAENKAEGEAEAKGVKEEPADEQQTELAKVKEEVPDEDDPIFLVESDEDEVIMGEFEEAASKPALVKQEPKEDADAASKAAPSSEPALKSRKLNKQALAKMQTELEQGGGKEILAVQEFSCFCIDNPGLAKVKGVGKLINTKLGKMYLSEQGALAFLKVMQEENKLSAKTMLARFGLIKKGIRAADLLADTQPAWAASGTRAPPAIEKWIKDLASTQAKTKPPAVEQSFLDFEQVDQHCIQQVIAIKAAPQFDICKVAGALLLRLISARSIRHINVADIKWADVGFGGSSSDGSEGAEPYLVVSVTKNQARMSTSKAVAAQPVSTLVLTDAASIELFTTWWEHAPAEIRTSPDHYFFPEFGPHDFIWEKKMSNECANNIVKDCALSLGLVRSDEHLLSFTTKCVRQGTAADTLQGVQEYIADRNKTLGRAASSKMELKTYVPPEVVMKPGALLPCNAAACCDQALQAALQAHAEEHKWQLLCKVCGYPHCQCPKCQILSEAVAASVAKTKQTHHTCWLEIFNNKTGRRSKKFMNETEDQFTSRLAAWQAVGLDTDIPVFMEGGYQFMQE